MQMNLWQEDVKQPLVVAYGMGLDSTAMLVGSVERGIRPDAILFADTGNEKQETYDYLAIINAYLLAHDMPEVTVVRYVPKNFKNWPPYHTLLENCLTNGTLPSIAFGFNSCSQKWKQAPQHTWMKKWDPAVRAWKAGLRVKKAIGFDCSPRDTKRYCEAQKFDDNSHYEYWYPLQEWGWDRTECARVVIAAGLQVPLKSSCTFCTAMKPDEVSALPKDKLREIVILEARAKPRLTTCMGLWRKSTKKRSGAMTDYIRDQGLLPASEIEWIGDRVPKQIIDYQDKHQRGEVGESLGQFIENLVERIPKEVAKDKEELAMLAGIPYNKQILQEVA